MALQRRALTFEDRAQIAAGTKQGLSDREIGELIGPDRSAVWRERVRNSWKTTTSPGIPHPPRSLRTPTRRRCRCFHDLTQPPPVHIGNTTGIGAATHREGPEDRRRPRALSDSDRWGLLGASSGSGAAGLVDDEHDLAPMARGGHQLMRPADLVERHPLGVQRLDQALGEHRPHRSGHPLADRRLLRHRPEAQRGGVDAGPLAQQRAQVELTLAAALQADRHLAPADRQGPYVQRQVLGAHDVQDHVCAVAVGHLHDGGHPVAVVVDRVVGAEGAAVVQVLRRAGGGQHGAAQRLAVLDGEGPDTARSAVHQQDVTGGQPGQVHVGHHGRGDLEQTGGLDQVDPRRRGDQLAGRGDHVLRVAAGGQQHQALLPGAPAGDTLTELGHHSGDLQPDDVGVSRRRRVVTLALQDVGPVHPGGDHPDQHLTGAGRRPLHLGDPQGLGAARFGGQNRVHEHGASLAHGLR
ncbi:hypothetical protein SDC9_74086 [bioreactor metagenome]|uniref:Uncharacterized protein n=1 Tax=bioreactor metagenome TaxID=1076179 RepID=A0A644YM50_9ZZZZ